MNASNVFRTSAVLFAVAGLSMIPLRAAEETELKDEAGKTIIRYVAEVPRSIAPAGTTDPAKQVGLFLCFPEHDRPTGDEILPVRAALARLGMSEKFVVIGGHPQGRKFGPEDHEPITKLIAWAKKTYPINPRRIYMYGKGEGSKISGEFAMMHPELVTSSIGYSWGWWKMPSELQQALDPDKSAADHYMVLGLRDLSHHLTTVRDTYSRVAAKGPHVIYREFEELGARTYHPPSNDDAIAWASRLRNKNIAPSAEEEGILKRYAAKPSVPAEGYFTGLALVGGAPAGAVLRKLLDSNDAAIRTAAAKTFNHGIFDEASTAALAAKTTDASPAVRKAAIRALAMHANWRSQSAQKALIELATAPGKALDQTDRVAAVDGIVYAIRYQLLGVRQDPQLFGALITLLGDKDEELRVMASNTLAPIRDRDFRGDLGRPEKKAPNGGWDQWLIDVTSKSLGYLKDYDVCRAKVTTEAAPYCEGGAHLLGYNLATLKPQPKNPALAFASTKLAAEQGYLPAQAALGMMYAVGKGVEQSFAEAAKWWTKAAEGGHVLAATNLSMVYRGGTGVPGNKELADKWTKFVAEHTSTGGGQ